jgi:hypothetical protein
MRSGVGWERLAPIVSLSGSNAKQLSIMIEEWSNRLRSVAYLVSISQHVNHYDEIRSEAADGMFENIEIGPLSVNLCHFWRPVKHSSSINIQQHC